MRRHAIEPTVFVVSVDETGKVNIMAAGWNVKTSYNPPMIAVALGRNSYTRTLIPKTKEFVVAVPSTELAKQLEYVGSVSGLNVDKLKHTDLKLQPGAEVKVSLLADARLNYECVLEKAVETGDHMLFVGRIVAAHYNVDKQQLYYAGRTPKGERIFKSVKTTFAEDR